MVVSAEEVMGLHQGYPTGPVLEHFPLLLNLAVDAEFVVVSIGFVLVVLVEVGVYVCGVCVEDGTWADHALQGELVVAGIEAQFYLLVPF